MTRWDAEHYLKYGNERTRAAADLLVRIRLESPHWIADLGCGPGNSTQLLRLRWPGAEVSGIDNSTEMLTSAKQQNSEQAWVLSDIADWSPDRPYDLVFSNAALQWLGNHDDLIGRLFGFVAPGGALAFQIPSSNYATIRTLMHEVSRDDAWNDRMVGAREMLTMESPAFYYDALVGKATDVDLWETEYQHVLASNEAIIDWIAGTGLRPFLAALQKRCGKESVCRSVTRPRRRELRLPRRRSSPDAVPPYFRDRVPVNRAAVESAFDDSSLPAYRR